MQALTAPQIEAARRAAEAILPQVLDLTARIAAIPAPTGDEGARSAFVAEEARRRGLQKVVVDDLGDVVATLPGRADSPPVLLAAHLDTVFPAGTPLPVSRDSHRLAAPGIGDNSLGVAALLCVPAFFDHLGVQPDAGVILAAPVGEEGLGNLRGMRAVVDSLPGIGAAVAIEGHNLGRVTHIAVGSRRLRVSVSGPGGHSWGDYGRPSAIHVLAKIIHGLAALELPSNPKTTLNVGLIEGGISVNTIAPSASFVLDMRSVDEESLRRVGEEVDRLIEQAAADGIRVTQQILGERPAGLVPLDSGIVEVATSVLAGLGIEAVCDASSTDANIPISRGIPAVCVGLTAGGNVHREDEFIEIDPLPTGLAQLGLVALGLAEDLAAGSGLGRKS